MPGCRSDADESDVLRHHLRLFGIRSTPPAIFVCPDQDALGTYLMSCSDGDVAILLQPDGGSCSLLGLTLLGEITPPVALKDVQLGKLRLRTLHRTFLYEGPGVALVADDLGRAAWIWMPRGHGGVLVIGSDVVADLIRYRQGDPKQAAYSRGADLWGIKAERPNYLFEAQRAGEPPACRHADNWAVALAVALEKQACLDRSPILPGNAPGALVITGDDDQAYLETYEEQQRILGRTPITYFLHHQTRHTRETLGRLGRRPWVDFGIHPDALDTPTQYQQRLDEQVDWYTRQVGKRPMSLRNHGFQNDGYWGHLPFWRAQGIAVSSNLPGLDGEVINGSLLPARVVQGGMLTEHWSILTAFGDGMISALGIDANEAAGKMRVFADGIAESSIPGVIVINLHPQNVGYTGPLHEMALEIIRGGFLAWNIRQCLDWFRQCDNQEVRGVAKPSIRERILSVFRSRS